MTDERDPLLDEIGRALAIEPSPEFAARVRMGVRQPDRAPWRVPTWIAAVVCVLVAGSWLVGVRVGRSTDPEIPTSGLGAQLSEPVSPARVVVPDISPRVARLQPTGRASATEPAPSSTRKVVIPIDDVQAFWELVAEVQDQGATLPAIRRPLDTETGEVVPLPDIAEIRVPALVIDPLPVGLPAESGGIEDE